MNEGAQLLDALAGFVRRFVVMSPSQANAVALWVVHTFAIDACEASPYLAVTSAEKRSGKTRLLDVLELVVARPWRVVMPSEAVLFRKLATEPSPTLLLDEVDAIFGPKANGNAEGLRALLNAGNRPGTRVPRCVGPSQTLTDFSVFSAKGLAAIRTLPDTVADRAIPIRLKRRAPGEPVQRFRRREADETAESLHEWARSWAEHHAAALAEARPDLPDELDDRAQDAWEPLLAIADFAGGDWPERARLAAVALSGAEARDEESAAVRLLADIHTIFTTHAVDRISSASLIAALHEIEDGPWGEWHGKPITVHGVAKLLHHHDVRPRTVRFDDGTTAKGYRLEQFEDVWARYLPFENVTTSQPSSHAGLRPISNRHTSEAVTDEKGPDSAWINGCDVVTDANPVSGDGSFADVIDNHFQHGRVTEAEWLERRKLLALIEAAA